MSTIPTVTEQTIRSLVREQSFQRGQDYFHSDTLFEMRRQGMTLKARCQGSSPSAYHVEVTFNDTEIVGTGCSCPVGCYCKHVAALLLAWQAHPEKFLEQQDIEAILEQCDKADLINVIKHMLERDANLESLVRTMLIKDVPVDPQFYRNQVESAFASGEGNYNYYDDYDDWDGGAGAADELETIRESADGFAQRGDFRSAIAAYKAIVTGVIEHYYEYEHESDEDALHEVIDECVEDFGKWLVSVQGDSTLREQILHILFTIFHFNIQAGGIGFGDEARDLLVEQTTAEERHTIASWVHEAISTRNQAQSDITYRTHWYNGVSFDEEIASDSVSHFATRALGDFLLELEADMLDDEAYLRICRETGCIRDAVERLLELQRVDEAAQAAQQASDFELLGIADLFVKAGQEAMAQDVIQKRAWKMQDGRLLEWLKEHSIAQNESADKLVQVEKQFREQPTIEGYKEIRRLAAQIGQWEKKRSEFLTFLSTNQHTELLIQIALDEDDTDEILKMVQAMGSPIKNGSSINRIIELVATAEETQPDVALHFYQRYVAYIIGHRNRQAYELASRFLIKIRNLYEKLGKNEVWTRYIARLYERNSNLQALKKVLAAAGL